MMAEIYERIKYVTTGKPIEYPIDETIQLALLNCCCDLTLEKGDVNGM